MEIKTVDHTQFLLVDGSRPLTANWAVGGYNLTGIGTLIATGTGTFGNITIFNPIPILVFKDSNNTGDDARGFIEWRDSNNARLGYFGNSSYSNDDLLWKNESSGGHIQVQTTGTGEFQIFANLDVSGDTTLSGDLAVNGDDITCDGDLNIIVAGYLGLVAPTGVYGNSPWVNTRYIRSADELQVGDLDRRINIAQNEIYSQGGQDFTIRNIQGDRDIILQILNGAIVRNLLTLNASVAEVDILRNMNVGWSLSVGRGLSVNDNHFMNKYLTIEGWGAMAASRGGHIEWKSTSSGTLRGYLFANNDGDLVISNTVETSPTDKGKASIKFSDGSAIFAAGAFDVDASGNVDSAGVYKVDGIQVVGNRVVDARCDDTINSGDATTDGVIDSLRDAMITHGLLAAA